MERPVKNKGAAPEGNREAAQVNTIHDHLTITPSDAQKLIDCWWKASCAYRMFALYVANVCERDGSAAHGLRIALRNHRLLARELRLAAFGGAK